MSPVGTSYAQRRLRTQLLVAMGLFPACGEDVLSGGRDGGTGPGTRDASITLPDAGGDAVNPSSAPDSSTYACSGGDGTPQRECLSREAMVELLTWGGGNIRPEQPLRREAEVDAVFLPNGCLPREFAQNGCCNAAIDEGKPEGTSCCYMFCTGACCGRPFYVGESARTADGCPRRDWVDATQCERAGTRVRALLASAWLEDALLEHASIAAFARFTLELLAFGAPAELVQAAQQAMADEIAHARSCFALASQYADAPVGPGPLSMDGVAPARTLRESVLCAVREGCIGETLAAAKAAAQRDESRDEGVRAVLARIADDEARHAELAYRFVAWALAREPALAEDVVRVVHEERLARGVQPFTVDAPELEAALRDAGRLGGRAEQRLYAETFTHVITPCLAALVAHVRGAERPQPVAHA